MKLRVQQKQERDQVSHHSQLAGVRQQRDSKIDRAFVADAILAKMSWGTYRVRKNLLNWLKEQTTIKGVSRKRVPGLAFDQQKKLGLITEAQVFGKIGAEARALRKANSAIFESLTELPVATLHECMEMLSGASLQKRYGTKIDDCDLPKAALPNKMRRKIEVSKQEVSRWARSKANKEVKQANEPLRQTIRQKAKRKFHRVTETIQDYIAGIKKFGAYVEKGLTKRREWMNDLEKRTGLKQKMHNSSDHA